jgi:glutamate formiminotransferase / 5-formyltetrahydrofolate cyclo-ligase
VQVIESVPNVSEGRRPEVIERLAGAIRERPGARLLDYSSDPSHNRSVFTFAGDATSVAAAVLALFEVAVASIDLRTHVGEHPRIGAVDVVPFVPIDSATMEGCVMLARQVGAAVASRHGIPVYLYEEAAALDGRRRLEHIRRGGLDKLRSRMLTEDWLPDFGPRAPHPSAGATVIGARHPLIAYNINLKTDRLDVAKAIAATVRESNGGLKFVKANGFRLAHRGIVQVSMNLTNYEQTPIFRVFEAVAREAARHGVDVLESEIIGLVPAAALSASTGTDLRLAGFGASQILENRLREQP